MRSLTNWNFGLDIGRLSLCRSDGAEGLELAVVEARGLTKAREADRRRRNTVKLRKCRHSIQPPGHGEHGRREYVVTNSHSVPFLRTDVWKRCILEYTSIQKFHDIESSTDYLCVLAQPVSFGNRYICAL